MSKEKIAHIYNANSDLPIKSTATAFQNRYGGQTLTQLGLTATNPDGVPLVFVPERTRAKGEDSPVQAHWRRAHGHGEPTTEHRFKRNDKAQSNSLEAAVKNGKMIVLNLNPVLSDKMLNFTHTYGHGITSEAQWRKNHHGNYLNVSVHAMADIASLWDNVKKWGGDVKEQCFARYQGAVAQHDVFYLGDKREQLAQLYTDLTNLTGGVPLGNHIMIGFPRILCYVPGDETLKNPTHKKDTSSLNGKLQGNYLKAQQGKPYLSQLIFTNSEDALRTDAFNILHQSIHSPSAQYVLASPSVETNKDPEDFKFTRWEIKDIEKQITPLSDEQNIALMKQIEAKHYSSSMFQSKTARRIYAPKRTLDLD